MTMNEPEKEQVLVQSLWLRTFYLCGNGMYSSTSISQQNFVTPDS